MLKLQEIITDQQQSTELGTCTVSVVYTVEHNVWPHCNLVGTSDLAS